MVYVSADDGMYAMKKVIIQNNEQLNLVREEIRVSSLFSHPNLLPLLDHAIIAVKVIALDCSPSFRPIHCIFINILDIWFLHSNVFSNHRTRILNSSLGVVLLWNFFFVVIQLDYCNLAL